MENEALELSYTTSIPSHEEIRSTGSERCATQAANEVISEQIMLMHEAKRLYQQQIAPGSRRVYASDWRIFSEWCQTQACLPEQATPKILALFLTAQLKAGFHPNTLNRRLAAIKFFFTSQAQESPTDHPLIRAIMKGIRRDANIERARPKKAAVVKVLKQMVDLCSADTLRGLRDRAILLLGFAGAYRRSELVTIDIADIAWQPEGMDIAMHRSKTDQEAKGDSKAIIKAEDKYYCPVLAVQQWLA